MSGSGDFMGWTVLGHLRHVGWHGRSGEHSDDGIHLGVAAVIGSG